MTQKSASRFDDIPSSSIGIRQRFQNMKEQIHGLKHSFSPSWVGPLCIAIAALLWATDSIVRYPAIGRLSPVFLVFSSHVLVVLALTPLTVFKWRKRLIQLSFRDWIAAILVGAGGSALALVFFTMSFSFVNPSVAILLQKLQPVIVIVLAFALLKEKISHTFYIWALLAIASGVVLSFPDLDFSFMKTVNFKSKGFYLALSAATLWALSTIFGKSLLNRNPPAVATYWRFFFGLVALTIYMLSGAEAWPEWQTLMDPKCLLGLTYLAFVPGMVAVSVYYKGLARTPASVATFVEMTFPIGAIALNAIFLGATLSPVQIGAAAVLLFAVSRITH